MQLQFLDRMVDFPVACRSWYRTVHIVLAVEISQVQLGRCWTRPLLCNNRCLGWGRAMLGSTMDTCYASFWVAFGRIYDFLREGADSAPELDSRPALLPVAGTLLTTVVACSILVLLVLTHLVLCSHDCRHFSEKCTVDASVAHDLHLEICALFLRVSCFFQHFQRSTFLRESIFWSPRALTPVSA